MKYRDILHFEPITEVIQFDLLDKRDYQLDILRNFVYPDYFLETIIPQIVNNLRFDGRDKHSIQIVGNYGTGKSHLMSLIILTAQDADNLKELRNDQAKVILEPIAGKFMVHRFELQTEKGLWSVVTDQMQRFLDANGVDYRFDSDSNKMYNEQLDEMMAAFEDKYPDKGFLLVIDEMLSYLEGQAAIGMLDRNLQVLQALGQQCARGHFGFMFGVQEMIYHSNKFAFAAEMLLKVKDRYRDLTIRREDVSFVVEKRLLGKTDEQKALIRKHLEKFIHLFPDMHAHLQDYVDLFPVHPSYFDNFQRIRQGQSQRQVLKTISQQFEKIKDADIPEDNPGLITYDQYWETIMNTAALMSIPDIKTVAETVTTVHDKIDANFEGVRARQIPLAKRIANATAIKILQGNLNKSLGVRAETLADDLCYTDALATEHDLLVDKIAACANLIIKATSGQFFDMNEENGEYHLRTEGGINYDQQITQFADQMSPAQKDDAFFRFIVDAFEIESTPYRTGFRIYQHEVIWSSHKITRDGYIFLGEPNEKSTTHPKQYFYLIFMPLFQEDKKRRNCEPDEVYFVMDGVSEDFKTLVCKYGAAISLYNSADQVQKQVYRTKYEDLFKKARTAFEATWLDNTMVYYGTEDGRKLKTYQLPGEGSRRIDKINAVASEIFENVFSQQTPHYPAFTKARQIITNDNRERYIKGAIAKLVQPSTSTFDGEAVLDALGCYVGGEINPESSIYAQSALSKLAEKDEGMVLNQNELLEAVPRSENIWRTQDFHIEADLEFIALAALVHNGDIEITLQNGTRLNASNIEMLRTLTPQDFYLFSHIARPRGLNMPTIKAISKLLLGKDVSARLADDDRDAFAKLTNAAGSLAVDAITLANRELRGAVNIGGVEIISAGDAMTLNHHFTALRGFGDKIKQYTSRARLRNLQWTQEELNHVSEYMDEFKATIKKLKTANELNSQVSYLNQARQYVPSELPLLSAIDSAVEGFGEVIANPTDVQVEAYKQHLLQVKGDYIAFYLKRYRSYCINDIENQKRVQLMNSPEFAVCRKLSEFALLNTDEWTHMREDFYRLKTANPNAETVLQTSPYIDFNPITSSRPPRSVHELGQDLDDLYKRWIETLRDFVKAPEQQETMRLMPEGDQNFLNRFINGLETISDEHAAECLLELLNKLGEGYDAVEISIDSMRCFFDRPLTMEQAQTQFDRYLIDITRGKQAKKVRIILR